MENHPIPQDVTGFKFKLIGSVTVKQFLYLLGFGILTTVAFILPISILLKIPLMVVFVLIGISLAFVPIEGRPMDIMLVNFAKAIPSENRYIYRKRGVNLTSFEFFKTPVKAMPTEGKNAQVKKTPQDEKKAILLSRLRNSPFRPDKGELEHLASVKSFFEEKDVSASAQITSTPVRQASSLAGLQTVPGLADAQSAPERASPTLAGGFPTLPDVPNVVLGIIKDPRGKTLPNILVEMIDPNGIPVRAFKTNALGQFASATPLQNGTYKVYFEDAQKNHEFEAIEITLNGEIFNPLEITSIDAREKLRRELFGNQTMAA